MDIFDINTKKGLSHKISEADYIIDNYTYWHGTKAKEKAKIPKIFNFMRKLLMKIKYIQYIERLNLMKIFIYKVLVAAFIFVIVLKLL